MMWQNMNDAYVRENFASVEQESFQYFNKRTDKFIATICLSFKSYWNLLKYRCSKELLVMNQCD